MIKTYSIGCRDCKKHLWIARGWTTKNDFLIYMKNVDVVEELRNFLWEHKGHNLIFDENCESELSEWEEIEVYQK